uniref:Uncharacterized protein n=1 Tax=Salix viminalis TaxID=40686 RepID=A0A6N2MIM3_SALVM
MTQNTTTIFHVQEYVKGKRIVKGKIGNTGPVRFERGAAAFNEASRVIRLYESGQSEHYSPDNNSADLINSFIERECQNQFGGGDQNYKDHQDDLEDSPNCSYLETKERIYNVTVEMSNMVIQVRDIDV